ncbi:MAG TPA: endonuclease [Tenuifilum sp.]|uniref:endonuclease/exonuclease/phosphatase family protein n=1 Tax=Tenuifilum sp. TaxID=2760880 RepID=UPI002C347272|nr:endonuclease [Tenuifilum sp.]
MKRSLQHRVFCLFRLVFLVCLAGLPIIMLAQNQAASRHRVMFYNVENLFDPFDDSLTRDDEFTPTGQRYWTWNKMETKINGIYKVIMAVGELDPPVLVGLCEVENGFVLHKLVNDTPLSKFEYRVVHRESPDPRGIDVALLYRPDRFKVQEREFVPVIFPDDSARKTREILYVSGMLGSDTLHVFVNHWPSKYGGELESESGRFAAASTLKRKIDSIRVFYPQARILVMGDLNDEPESAPVVEGLGACERNNPNCPSGLINIAAILKSRGFGSYKYQGTWGIIDQIIVSQSLLSGKHRLYTTPQKAAVFESDQLLEPDKQYSGNRPFRTFIGYRYHGGFSDHLPVYIDLLENEP